jgi:hypothetical protein
LYPASIFQNEFLFFHLLFWRWPVQINLLIQCRTKPGLAATSNVRRTFLCAAQCAHFAVRHTVHCAHSMLTEGLFDKIPLEAGKK